MTMTEPPELHRIVDFDEHNGDVYYRPDLLSDDPKERLSQYERVGARFTHICDLLSRRIHYLEKQMVKVQLRLFAALPTKEKRIEDWLHIAGYAAAVERCPVDGGEYVGAEETEDVLEDFLGQNPDCESQRDTIGDFLFETGPYSLTFGGDTPTAFGTSDSPKD